MSEPNKANIRKWVKALRSGKFLQVRGTLRGERKDGEVGYCCLGVGHKVAGIDDRWEAGTFVPAASEFFGIESHDPQLWQRNGAERSASSMNDAGCKFTTIADAIERTYLPKPRRKSPSAQKGKGR